MFNIFAGDERSWGTGPIDSWLWFLARALFLFVVLPCIALVIAAVLLVGFFGYHLDIWSALINLLCIAIMTALVVSFNAIIGKTYDRFSSIRIFNPPWL
jgi:hypothetical protein